MSLNLQKVRHDFPILSQKINGKPLVYFDNAATTQKPQAMLDKLIEYYTKFNSNIHRGVHTLSQKATEEFEATRELIAKLYNCEVEEVIFTKNDTESLNLLAYTLGKKLVKENPNGNIVISEVEHHSNIVPWQKLLNNYEESDAAKIKVSDQLRYLPFTEDGMLDTDNLANIIDQDTLIFAFSAASNTFGILYNIAEIVATVRKLNPNTKIIIDAAQYVPHAKFDFKALDADFITFSAHKLCGPTGLGILIGKKELLEEMPPFLSGGDMIKEVTKEETTFNNLPYKFEAGTPNIADVIAFGATLRYLEGLGWENIQEQEERLAKKLIEELSKLDFVEIYGINQSSILNIKPLIKKLALVSFNLKGMHAHDVGTLLDEDGIAVRTGHHCTQLIMTKLGIPASVRASLYFYNTEEEIDVFIESLKQAYQVFN